MEFRRVLFRSPQVKLLLAAMQEGVAEAVTEDTAYGISANLQAATCTVHSGGVYVPSEYELSGSGAAGTAAPAAPAQDQGGAAAQESNEPAPIP